MHLARRSTNMSPRRTGADAPRSSVYKHGSQADGGGCTSLVGLQTCHSDGRLLPTQMMYGGWSAAVLFSSNLFENLAVDDLHWNYAM